MYVYVCMYYYFICLRTMCTYCRSFHNHTINRTWVVGDGREVESREASEKGNQGEVVVLGEEGMAYQGEVMVLCPCFCLVFVFELS